MGKSEEGVNHVINDQKKQDSVEKERKEKR